MAENSKIEWTDHTFNPWIGCTKVGPGCDHCYAEGWAKRAGKAAGVVWGGERKRTSLANWRKPLLWHKKAKISFDSWNRFKETFPGLTDDELQAKGFIKPIRPRVFCASLADVFDNQVPSEWRDDLWRLIEATPNLDWLLLTKRIGNVGNMLPVPFDFDRMYPHVWIGATITSQAEADRDIPKLLDVPAKIRFLSMEPLLGPVDFYKTSAAMGSAPTHPWANRPILQGIDWVIVGGESGPGARPMHPDWARSLRDQCETAGVPFLFKQWGDWVPRSSAHHTFADGLSCADIDPGAAKWPCIRLTPSGHNGRDLAHSTCGDEAYMQRTGKAFAGRLLDGVEHNGFPST